MMDRTDIERLTKMETKLEEIEKQLTKILEKLEGHAQTELDCDSKFVKQDDDNYWDRNMKRYESEKLSRSNTILSVINHLYKLIIAVAGIIIIVNNAIK